MRARHPTEESPIKKIRRQGKSKIFLLLGTHVLALQALHDDAASQPEEESHGL